MSTLDVPGAPARDSTPEMRADDLARLLIEVDAGPAVVLGSSGGPVSVLALVHSRPGPPRSGLEATSPVRTCEN